MRYVRLIVCGVSMKYEVRAFDSLWCKYEV